MWVKPSEWIIKSNHSLNLSHIFVCSLIVYSIKQIKQKPWKVLFNMDVTEEKELTKKYTRLGIIMSILI